MSENTPLNTTRQTSQADDKAGNAWNAREVLEHCLHAFPRALTKPAAGEESYRPIRRSFRSSTHSPMRKPPSEGESAALAIFDYLNQIPILQNEKKAQQLGFLITREKEGYSVFLTDGSTLRVQKDCSWGLTDRLSRTIEQPETSDIYPTLDSGLLYANFDNFKQLSGPFGTIAFAGDGVIALETLEGLSLEIRKKPDPIFAGKSVRADERHWHNPPPPPTNSDAEIDLPPFSSDWL